jgi:hypothetical protein
MEQLKVCTNDLPSVAKKEATVIAALVLSTEAFPTAGLIHHLEVPTTAVTSIPGRKVGGGVLELRLGWPTGDGGGQYPAGGSGGDHVEGCLAAGDPPHDITGVGPI